MNIRILLLNNDFNLEQKDDLICFNFHIMIIKNMNVEYARVSLESFAVLLSNRTKSVFWRNRRRGGLKEKR